MYRPILGTALSAALCGGAVAQTPPASAFGRLPAVVQAAISPGGERIAILGGAPADRTLSFTVIDQPGVNVLRLGDVETVSVRWAGDDYALARVAGWEKVGPRAAYRLERNVAVTPEAKVASYLLKNDAASSYLVSQPIIGITRSPLRVLVRGLHVGTGPDRGMDTRMARKGGDGNPLQAALFSVDPATGRGAPVERGDFDTEAWDVDLSGQARVMIGVDELTGKYRLHARPKGGARWQLIQDGSDPENVYLGYSDPDDAIYFARYAEEGAQVLRRRLADGVEEPVGPRLAKGEVWLVWDDHRATPIGIGGTTGSGIEWLDAEIGAAHGTLARAFKGKAVTLWTWSQDRTRFIARVEGADAPPAWYLYDKPRKEVSPVGEAYPELADAPLGRTNFMTYKARDGLEIPAYVTVPAAAPAGGAKLPLVVLPHGGPAAHDDDGFDYLAHFLASRGYAVLRPQYRGSTGFGRELERAGEGEWGGKMQTDLLDGVAALAASGVADPQRVCIVGASFGGYSALMGAVFHAGSYRCAASIAGVSDLGLLLSQHVTNYGPTSKSFRSLRKQLTGATNDKLASISPLKSADRAAAPILLMHGEQDTIVPADHSRLMAEALRQAGKPVDYVVFAGDNHYLTKSASRIQMLEMLEGFLGKHLAAANP